MSYCYALYTYSFITKAHGPKIITHPTDTSGGAPFSALFTCSATGYGKVSIEWKRKGSLDVPVKSYHTEESLHEFTTSIFIIPNVSDDDSGRYYCISWIGMEAFKSKSALLYYSGKLRSTYMLSMICSNNCL